MQELFKLVTYYVTELLKWARYDTLEGGEKCMQGFSPKREMNRDMLIFMFIEREEEDKLLCQMTTSIPPI
jgi:hypothetical protein